MATHSQLEELAAAPAPAKPQRVPVEIDRLFQGSLLLLITTGFGTLASTGKLDAISIAFTAFVLLVRGYFFLTRREVQIEERWTSYLGLIYIAVYLADLLFISRDFVTSSVHLVLFGMAVKLFSVRRERDHVYLAVLAFLEILSAAVLTVDTIFLISFGIFTLIAVVTFMAMEMRRSAIAATEIAQNSVVSANGRARIEIAISNTGLAMLAAIAVIGAAIFFVLPRLSYGYLSRLTQQNTLVSGFSDNVTLGQIGRIQQSSQVVMHVKVEGGNAGSYQFKIHGTSLVNFDGRRWSNSPHDIEIYRTVVTGGLDLEQRHHRSEEALHMMAKAERHRLIRYRIMMEPLGTNIVFLITRPLGLSGRFRELAIDSDNTIQNLDNGRTSAEYGGYSDIAEPSESELRDSTSATPVELIPYLQIPDSLDPRIRQLAHQIADQHPTPYDKAISVERYLITQYGYTLDLGTEAASDPLAKFLFTRKRGHCEYFASSMAIMLRELGIPTRIVTGFRGGEYNSISGSYIIRARDAHSWVEAYIPAKGWTVFDPTPSSASPPPAGWARIELYLDAMREFWREWVINYDIGHQQTLAVSTLTRSRNSLGSARERIISAYERIMRWARGANAEVERNPKAAARRIALIATGILILFQVRNLVRLVRRVRIAQKPSRAPQSAASIWYERMLRTVARHGYRRTSSSQTPTEFAASITDRELRDLVQSFTAHYEKARFGNSLADAEKLPDLVRRLRALQK